MAAPILNQPDRIYLSSLSCALEMSALLPFSCSQPPSQTALSLPTLFSSCNLPLDHHLSRDPFPYSPLPIPVPVRNHLFLLKSQSTSFVLTYIPLHIQVSRISVFKSCGSYGIISSFIWENAWVLFISESPLTTTSVPVYTVTTKSMLTEQNLRFLTFWNRVIKSILVIT